MAEIVQSFAGDRAIRLYNEDFVRKLGIGTAWTKIRIGLRFSINATSAVNTTTFTFGVCQGDTNTFKSGTTTDYFGVLMGTAVNPTFAFQAGPPAYVTANAMAAIGRIGNTNTIVNNSTSTLGMATTPASIRSILTVDIEKQFTSMRCVGYAPATSVTFDWSLGSLMTMMEGDNNSVLGAFTTNQIPYSGAGLFDSLNVSWNNGIQPLEISEMLVVRIY